jgi:hypothetical protein
MQYLRAGAKITVNAGSSKKQITNPFFANSCLKVNTPAHYSYYLRYPFTMAKSRDNGITVEEINHEAIEVHGARVHNLKNIDISIP